MQSPDTKAVAALILAVAKQGEPIASAASIPLAAGRAPSGDAGLAGVQEQLKAMKVRIKSVEHETRMRVEKIEWQREMVEFRTDMQATHALELTKMQQQFQQDIKDAVAASKENHRLEMKEEIAEMFKGLLAKTQEVKLEMDVHKMVVNAQICEHRSTLTSQITIVNQHLNTVEEEAKLLCLTAHRGFVTEFAGKIAALTLSMRTKHDEAMQDLQEHNHAMLQGSKSYVHKMAENANAHMQKECAEHFKKITSNLHTDNNDIKECFHDQVGVLQHRMITLEEKMESVTDLQAHAQAAAEKARRAEEARRDAEQARRAEEVRSDAEQARRAEEVRSDAEQARRAEETRGNAMRAESPRAAFPPAAHHTTQFSHRLSSEHNKGLNAEPTYVRDCPPGINRNHKSFVHENGDLFTDEEFEKAMDQLRASLLREEQQDALCRTPTPYASASSMQSTASKRSSLRNIDVLATTIKNALQSGSFEARGGAIWNDFDAAGSGPAAGGLAI